MVFEHEVPENGAEGAILESSFNLLEKLFPKTEIKSKKYGYMDLKIFSLRSFRKMDVESNPESNFPGKIGL